MKPHFKIVDKGVDRTHRWFLIPRNRWLNIYLHKTMGDDPQPLHDHEYDNCSIILKGGYYETILTDEKYIREGTVYGAPTITRFYEPGSIIVRRAAEPHRLALPTISEFKRILDGARPELKKQACWSIFITLRRKRKWGFWTKYGWKPFNECVYYKDGISTVKPGSEELMS